jgi:hypothetical protein
MRHGPTRVSVDVPDCSMPLALSLDRQLLVSVLPSADTVSVLVETGLPPRE